MFQPYLLLVSHKPRSLTDMCRSMGPMRISSERGRGLLSVSLRQPQPASCSIQNRLNDPRARHSPFNLTTLQLSGQLELAVSPCSTHTHQDSLEAWDSGIPARTATTPTPSAGTAAKDCKWLLISLGLMEATGHGFTAHSAQLDL